jgi:hypothetical protein
MDDFPLDCGRLARRPVAGIILLRDESRKSVDESDHCRIKGSGTPSAGAERESSVRTRPLLVDHEGFYTRFLWRMAMKKPAARSAAG